MAIQQARGVLEDLRKEAFKVFFMPKEEFEAKGKELFIKSVSPGLVKLEFLLNGKKFITGNNLTVVDFFLFETMDFGVTFDPTLFDNLPNIK